MYLEHYGLRRKPFSRPRIRSSSSPLAPARLRAARGLRLPPGPLDLEETGRHLSHRLAVAGRTEPLFDDEAVAAVHRHSGGLPRRVNQVAASALLEGFAREVDRISAEVVEESASDLAAHMGTPARAR